MPSRLKPYCIDSGIAQCEGNHKYYDTPNLLKSGNFAAKTMLTRNMQLVSQWG